MSPKRNEQLEVGQDSFLDTTANLVGILIILVVVIGTKTKIDAVELTKQKIEDEKSATDFSEPAEQVVALKQSLQKQQETQQRYTFETEYRRRERDLLLTQVVRARALVEQKLASVEATERERIEQAQAIDELESDLKDTLNLIESNQAAAERPKLILEHLPTPMARTVFTKELHVLINKGLVTIVPWDRLVETLKVQAPLTLRRKRPQRGVLDDTLGPVQGFLMHYRMAQANGGFELDRFELEITPSSISETLEEALRPAGRLRLELASRDPAQTVVTVWIYPDSFDQYRQLKAQLFDEGFLSAARPLPDGVRIGASPRGSRSSAQ